jgi:hypothetical protein
MKQIIVSIDCGRGKLTGLHLCIFLSDWIVKDVSLWERGGQKNKSGVLENFYSGLPSCPIQRLRK